MSAKNFYQEFVGSDFTNALEAQKKSIEPFTKIYNVFGFPDEHHERVRKSAMYLWNDILSIQLRVGAISIEQYITELFIIK